jgi:hypothetical protein
VKRRKDKTVFIHFTLLVYLKYFFFLRKEI